MKKVKECWRVRSGARLYQSPVPVAGHCGKSGNSSTRTTMRAEARKAIDMKTKAKKSEGSQSASVVKVPASSGKKQSQAKSHMYAQAKTWNPFKGCRFDCTYCIPTFKAQSKRRVECKKCQSFEPHTHASRLAVDNIPTSDIVFVCGFGDIAFCPPAFMDGIIKAIKARNLMSRKPQTFYLQTKRPDCLKPFLHLLPENVVLVSTIETNRDENYDLVSKAPVPSKRYAQFLALDYPRKIVTVEPVMDFDVAEFAEWIIRIRPEYLWLGLNSHEKAVRLPEPTEEKLREFTRILTQNGIKVRGKELRGMKLPGVESTQG